MNFRDRAFGSHVPSLDVKRSAESLQVLTKRVLTPQRLTGYRPELHDLISEKLDEAIWLNDRNLPMTSAHKASLEAVVLTNGRPALPTKGGLVVTDTPEARGWPDLEGYRPLLKPAIDAVGRIDLAGAHIGTGFVIAPNLVLTNRHVAEVIGKAYRQPNGDRWLLKAGGLWIDFEREEGSDAVRRHEILRVVASGPDAINMKIDPKHLDAAILEISPKSKTNQPCPAPVRLLDSNSLDVDAGGDILSIGYPGSPQYEPKGEAPTDEEGEVLTALKRMFELIYGVKRVSPGKILSRVGRVPDGNRGWTFTHDATTLYGASGSYIVRYQAGAVFGMGLHFGGEWLKENFAHSLPRIYPGFLERFIAKAKTA